MTNYLFSTQDAVTSGMRLIAKQLSEDEIR
jgi:hypothetical protein